jgi:hypothetical protein
MVDENRIVDEGGAVAACAARSLPAAVGARSREASLRVAVLGSVSESRSSAAVQDNCTVDEGWTGSYGHRRVRTGEADPLTRDLATCFAMQRRACGAEAWRRCGQIPVASQSRINRCWVPKTVALMNVGSTCAGASLRSAEGAGKRCPNPRSVPDSRTLKAVQKIALSGGAQSDARAGGERLVIGRCPAIHP